MHSYRRRPRGAVFGIPIRNKRKQRKEQEQQCGKEKRVDPRRNKGADKCCDTAEDGRQNAEKILFHPSDLHLFGVGVELEHVGEIADRHYGKPAKRNDS